jgi:hypothetical protein
MISLWQSTDDVDRHRVARPFALRSLVLADVLPVRGKVVSVGCTFKPSRVDHPPHFVIGHRLLARKVLLDGTHESFG